ncbi:hypothetical protein UFOVP704_3 [uncultured Caudovirales phage]|jgi:hypothetical protein|uniref:Uncharacterized protein n=1 Tax=uncultured Caudovirales phage TaxID=2100421 RepID=A0A6J5NGP5_9CAUD|nr:hypothetical protein UFOVP704_3 [uncultured Caudovirales phage]
MIVTTTWSFTTLDDIRNSISESNPTMFKDLTTKELKYILKRVLPIKVDKSYSGTLVHLEVIIKALYEDVTQSDIPNTLNIYVDTWTETLSPYYERFVLEKTTRFIYVIVH